MRWVRGPLAEGQGYVVGVLGGPAPALGSILLARQHGIHRLAKNANRGGWVGDEGVGTAGNSELARKFVACCSALDGGGFQPHSTVTGGGADEGVGTAGK